MTKKTLFIMAILICELFFISMIKKNTIIINADAEATDNAKTATNQVGVAILPAEERKSVQKPAADKLDNIKAITNQIEIATVSVEERETENETVKVPAPDKAPVNSFKVEVGSVILSAGEDEPFEIVVIRGNAFRVTHQCAKILKSINNDVEKKERKGDVVTMEIVPYDEYLIPSGIDVRITVNGEEYINTRIANIEDGYEIDYVTGEAKIIK